MSISDQVIHVIELDGTTKQIKLYTDISDVTEVYKDFLYNGQTLYASTTTDPDDEYATGLKYLDEGGVVRYLCTENPIPEKSGTVIINGNLSTDLIVDGNLQVSGTISGNAKASGRITYGTLTGTITAGASFTSCDVLVEDGSLTFANGIDKNGGVLYTTGLVEIASGTVVSLYSSLTIENSSSSATSYGFYTRGGNFTIGKNATVNISSSSQYAMANTGAGTVLIVNGKLIVSSVSDSRAIHIGTSCICIINEGATVEAVGGTGLEVYNNSTVTINGTCTTSGSAYGINNYVSSNIVINGTLISNNTNEGSYGIYNGGNASSDVASSIVIESGGTVKTSGYRGVQNGSYGNFIVRGTLTATGSDLDYNGPGIRNSSNSTFTIETGGVVEATGYRGVTNTTSSEFIVNGNLTAIGTDQDYNGIGVFNTSESIFTIESGGVVEATGYEGAENYNSSDFIVKGTLTATTENSNSNAYGMYASGNETTVSGTLYAIAPTDSRCIYGTVTTTGSGKIYKNGVLQ